MRTLVLLLMLVAAAAWGQEANIVCAPDPLEIAGRTPGVPMDVVYLGGGSDTLFAYALGMTWDPTIVRCMGIAEGNLFDGHSPYGTWFVPYVYADSLYVMHFNLGYVNPGTLGPGTMFTTYWAGISAGESPMKLHLDHTRNNENEELTGFVTEDGLIVVSGTSVPAADMSWGRLKALYR